MLYLVINVLLQVIGFYLIFSTPQTEAWGPPPRALLGLLLVGLSLLTGLIFSLGVIWSKKHSRTVSALLVLGMFAIPLVIMLSGWLING